MVGLYRSDGVAAIKVLKEPKTERVKKVFTKVLNDYGTKVKANLYIRNFLDLKFNLCNIMFEQEARQSCCIN